MRTVTREAQEKLDLGLTVVETVFKEGWTLVSTFEAADVIDMADVRRQAVVTA